MRFVSSASVMSAGLGLVLFVLIGCEGRSESEEGVGEAEVPMEDVSPAMAVEGEEGEEGEGGELGRHPARNSPDPLLRRAP